MSSVHRWLFGLVVAVATVLIVPSPHVSAGLMTFQEGDSPTGAYEMGATYIRSKGSDGPSANYDDDSDLELIAGTTDGGDVLRAMLEFDISEIPVGNQIDSVSLDLTTLATNAGIGGTQTFNLHAYDLDFNETTATWNNPDVGGTDVAGGTLGDLLNSASFDVTGNGLSVPFSARPRFALLSRLPSRAMGCFA